MSILTMNVEQMEHLQRQFTGFATQVEELRVNLSATLEGTTWTGARSVKFRGAWQQQWSPTLAQLQEALLELSQAVALERQNTIAALDTV